MAFPSEHSARIENPDNFMSDSFSRKEITSGVNIIIGKKTSDGSMETQSYRFDKSKFTPEQAKEWLEKNKINFILFEPAEELVTKSMSAKQTYEVTKDIFSVGNWNGDEYTEKDLEEMEKNFTLLKDKVKVPFKVDFFKKNAVESGNYHGGMPSCGWITDLKKVGKKLYAHIENIPKVIKELIDKKAYRQVSAEIVWNMKNGEERLRKVLTGVALLGVEMPGVSNLDEFGKLYMVSYEDDEQLKIYEYSQGKIKDEFVDVKFKNGEDKKMDETLVKQYQDQISAKDVEIKKYAEQVAGLEKEKQEAMEKVSNLALEQKKVGIKTFVEKCITEGRLLPAHKSMATAILENSDSEKTVKFTLADKEQDFSITKLFESFVESLPKLVDIVEKSGNEEANLKTFQAKPVEEGGNVDSQKLDFLVKEYLEKNKDVKGMNYEMALKEVSKQNPDLCIKK